jgi:20S proteasome subunit alpha 5
VIELENNNWLSLIQDLTLQEAETIALSILKQVMEEKVWRAKLVSLLQISVIT